ncbi:hypothetical protein, partial [Marinoscillum sp.]|uniref:hypothetical protein n=1 Tax=Marinoscillum sp. TaxID=2024838 RepID=UPI00387362A8
MNRFRYSSYLRNRNDVLFPSRHSGFGRAQRWTKTGISRVLFRLQFGVFEIFLLVYPSTRLSATTCSG